MRAGVDAVRTAMYFEDVSEALARKKDETMTKLTADTITDEQIRALQAEAAKAGDDKQTDLCRLALGMTPMIAWNLTPYAARIRCADAINEARAQA